MPKEQIMVVEDDDHIRELISYNLVKEGYRVTSVGSGEDAIARMRSLTPNLILLDLMLPGMDGLEVCKALKKDKATQTVPIVMLTAKGEETDIVSGLELGAEDYIVKPFSPKVLTARIRTVLRRRSAASTMQDEPVFVNGLLIHPGRHEVVADGKAIELTFTEFKVLHFLASRPGWVYTRFQIVDAVRGDNYPVTDRSVDVLIVGLRKKLGHHGKFIETVRGVGYRFKEELDGSFAG